MRFQARPDTEARPHPSLQRLTWEVVRLEQGVLDQHLASPVGDDVVVLLGLLGQLARGLPLLHAGRMLPHPPDPARPRLTLAAAGDRLLCSARLLAGGSRTWSAIPAALH